MLKSDPHSLSSAVMSLRILLFICVALSTSHLVVGQSSINQLGFDAINNLENTHVKVLKVSSSNEVDGSRKLKVLYKYNSEGKITHSTHVEAGYETFEADTLERVYHYSITGRSKIEFHRNKNISTQEIQFQLKGIEVHIFTMYEIDTTAGFFDRWEKRCTEIIDTVNLSEYEKISKISFSHFKQQRSHLTISKAVSANDRIQKEVSYGRMPGVVNWQYDGRNFLTKTYFNEKGEKYRLLRYGAHGELLEEEQFGAPFDFRTRVEYTATGKVRKIEMLDSAGYITMTKKYMYSNNLLVLVEQYTSHNNQSTTFIYEYSFQ